MTNPQNGPTMRKYPNQSNSVILLVEDLCRLYFYYMLLHWIAKTPILYIPLLINSPGASIPYIVNINHNTNPFLIDSDLIVELYDTLKLVVTQRKQQVIVNRATRVFNLHGDYRAIQLHFPQPRCRKCMRKQGRWPS